MMNLPALVAPVPGAELDLLARHAHEAGAIRRKGLWVLGVGVLPALAWMAFAPLASAVVASGFVKVDQNRRTVQHAEGGTVSAVYVRDGQKVRQGEPLMELGDIAVAADSNRLGYRLLAEKASTVRLDAEQLRRSTLVWPSDLVEAAQQDATLSDHLLKEQSLFAARRDALSSQSELLRKQRTKIDQEMGTLRLQIKRLGESMAAQRRELENNRALLKDGYIASTRVLQLEAAVSDYAAKMEERRGELVRAEQRIVDIDLKLRSLDNDYRQQASDQLKVTSVRIQEIEQELRKATDASTRQVILAPVDGEVIGLRVTNPGTVIGPREPVADVLPANPKLLVEARIRPEDINRVQVGQKADLRFTAYQYRTTHMVAGAVAYVSADRLVEPQTQEPYYAVQVEVDTAAVTEATGGEKLQAGMPAEVYLQGGERTPLQYLLEPITQVLRKAGRER